MMNISRKTIVFVCFYLMIGLKLQAQEIDSLKLDSIPENKEQVFNAEDFGKSDDTETKCVYPKFKGKDRNTFKKWVMSKVVYPRAAAEKGTKGKVIVGFTIDTVGKVTDVHIVLGVSKELNAEAIRVISSSPQWTPGYINDKPVRVGFQFPINFGLEDAPVQFPWDSNRNNNRNYPYNNRMNY